MKNVYLVIIASCACLMTFIPQRVSAQCTCTGGAAATPITQSITITPMVTSSLNFTFQQFDPSIGTLSCVSLRDTITAITVSSALNTGPDSTAFLFELTVPSKITAPGISISKVFTRTYGYDTLAPHGDPGYSITYGPDTVANNYTGFGSTGGNALYEGTGTVGLVYAITGGGLSVLDGGLNDTTAVATTLGGTLNLTYYWCPAAILANSISNFTAAKDGNYIQLKWQLQVEQKNISYEVEYSTDGNSFSPITTMQSSANADGSLASYQYQFSAPLNTDGKLFFRIKRTSADGKTIVYSAIKAVNLNNAGISGYHTYPNPVRSYTMIEFDQVLSGNYIVDLISTTGQNIQHKEVSLSGTNQIRLDLTSHPATGLYYLQVKDKTSNQQYISKLVIE
jgi:hypothetical protein